MHFGALRVVDEASRQLTLRNVGRYDVAYRLTVGSQVQTQGGRLPQGTHAMQAHCSSLRVWPHADQSKRAAAAISPNTPLRLFQRLWTLCQLKAP